VFNRDVSHADLQLLGRVGLAFGLCFLVGFERELRGSPAGERTYAMVGLASAAITAVTIGTSPQAVGGVVTGVGFIGAGLVFRDGVRNNIRGITSAATIFAVAAIGVVAGSGHPVLAVVLCAMVLVDLEARNIPVLRHLDARRYADRAREDMEPPLMKTPSSPAGGSAT
jgi:putative Mg2+ transporter-C (MgtC) family protein